MVDHSMCADRYGGLRAGDPPSGGRATIEKLYYVVTCRCNVGCEFCYYATGALERAAELGTHAALSIVEEAGASGIGTLAFTGGEPLLRPDIVELVAAAERAEVRTVLVSSGSGLTASLARELGSARLGTFALSIHEGSEGELRLVQARLDMLCQARLKVRCNFLLSLRSAANAAAVLQMLRRFPSVEGFFQPLSLPLGHKDRADLCIGAAPAPVASELLDRMSPWCEAYGLFEYRNYLLDYYNSGVKSTTCNISRRSLVVDADGTVYLCFYRKDRSLGKVVRGGLPALIGRAKERDQRVDASRCRGEQCLVPYYFADLEAGRGAGAPTGRR